LVIIAKQVHVLVDDHPGDESVIENLLSIPHALATAFTDGDALAPHHRAAATVGLLAITALLAWKSVAPARLRFLPGALVAVVAAAGLGRFLHTGVKTVDVQSDLLAAVQWLPRSDPRLFATPAIWQAAVTMALIA